jgi:hypothetical protein
LKFLARFVRDVVVEFALRHHGQAVRDHVQEAADQEAEQGSGERRGKGRRGGEEQDFR